MRRAAAFLAVAGLVLAACASEQPASPKPACPTQPPTSVSAQATLLDAELATMTVSGAASGVIVIELYGDAAPIAAASFVALARCGFYDGISFHRVLSGFVIQAGDPQTKGREGDFEGLGTGGPGYEFAIEPPADELGYDPYSVSMANDQRTNGSQFFIALADLNGGLERAYTIFGHVVSGTDVAHAIAAVPVNDPRIGVPLTTVRIDSIEISAVAEPSPSGG